MIIYMKDSNAPPQVRFIPPGAGRAPVVTAVYPPGKPDGSTAVTSFYPGFDTTNPGCSVAIFRRQAAVFYIPDSSASAGPDNIGRGKLINADRSLTLSD